MTRKCEYCRKEHTYIVERFCSKECFEKTDEYKSFKYVIHELWSSLNTVQKLHLWSLWDNGYLMDEDYEPYIDKIIERPDY